MFFSRDGVTVGRHIQGIFTAGDHDQYPYLNFGAKVLVQAADATVKNAGDGTTTTAVMAAGMLRAFLETMPTATGKSIVKELKAASEKNTGSY
jgi:chaperonin GroEL (HSP60 family)